MNPCPCGSEQPYDNCCGPLISGTTKATTAEILLRSRYTAHCNVEMDYIASTILPSQIERHDASAVEEWAKSTEWDHLEILNIKDGGEEDEIGWIEFKAYFKKFEDVKEHHEFAKFVKEDGVWYFDDQQDDRREPERREEPKVGRNDPCPCGSGAKYKKCCGR
ncbi:MAG: YchJ family protein [Planctomycetota bacterium]|jgi:SEC-C motif-containing protein